MTKMTAPFVLAFLLGCAAPTVDSQPPDPATASVADVVSNNPPKTAHNAPDTATEGALEAAQRLIGGGSTTPYKLTEGLPLYFVGVDALRKYDKSVAPASIIQDASERLYSVLQENSVVGSVTMRSIDGKWSPVVVGRGPASGRLQEARSQLRGERKADDDLYSLVQVPGLQKRFLLHRENAIAYLTEIQKSGFAVAQPAAIILEQIADRARATP